MVNKTRGQQTFHFEKTKSFQARKANFDTF